MKKLPASNSGIISKNNKKLPRVLFIRFNLQSFFLEINIIPNSNRLLVINIRCRRVHHRPTRVPPTHHRLSGRVHRHTVVVIVRSG
ncbi:hypothetical protein Hanom_Chr14g01316461 [Helianthus anomalus]